MKPGTVPQALPGNEAGFLPMDLFRIDETAIGLPAEDWN
jgi:hypothetical protein